MADESAIDAPTPDPAAEPVRDEQGRFAADPVETPEAVEAEAATDDVDDGEEGGDEPDLQDGKKRGKNAQARIDELTRNWRETQRELALVKGLVSQSTPISPEQGADKPQLDDFETYDEYVDKLTDWKVDQKFAKTSQESAQRNAGQIQQATWATKLEAALPNLPDYEAIVGASETPVVPHVVEALMEADHGPELAYHLAKNPAVVERLNAMSPAKAAMEVARLEAQITAPAARPTTKAPAPVNPLRPAPALQSDLAKAQMDDYVAMRAKQGASWAR